MIKIMDNTFETYSTFYSLEESHDLTSLLREHDIEHKIEQNHESSLGSFYVGNSGAPKYALKIKSNDFQKLNNLLGTNNEGLNEQHYFNQYSNEELIEVISEFDKWISSDIEYALFLLKSRGNELSDDEVEKIKQKRIKELKQTKSAPTWQLVTGYLAALVGLLFILAPVMGWSFMTLKKTLPTGEKVFVYDGKSRKQGMYLMVIGSLIGIVYMILAMFIYV